MSIKHSEPFETAQRDQTQLQGSSEVMAAHMSDYQKKKKNQTCQNHKPLVPAVVVAAIRMANQDLMTDL